MRRTMLSPSLQHLVAGTRYVVIATDGPNSQPWNSPVVGFFDDQLNLFWASWSNNEHSRNIARDPRIFAVVFDATAPLGEGDGVYAQMIARMTERGADFNKALKVYTAGARVVFTKRRHCACGVVRPVSMTVILSIKKLIAK